MIHSISYKYQDMHLLCATALVVAGKVAPMGLQPEQRRLNSGTGWSPISTGVSAV